MALPQFTVTGELPPGTHPASLRETLERFAVGSPQRAEAGHRLQRVHHLAAGTGQLVRFVVFGSFVTAETEPQDVDVFLVMKDSFDVRNLEPESALLFDYVADDAPFPRRWPARMRDAGRRLLGKASRMPSVKRENLCAPGLADVHFGATVFWVRWLAIVGSEQTILEHWQTKRDGARRGIVEIVG